MVRVSVCSGRSNLGYSCRLLSIGIFRKGIVSVASPISRLVSKFFIGI
jgi:hypothetical protein